MAATSLHCVSILGLVIGSNALAAEPLVLGRYTGYIEPEDSHTGLAVTADFIKVSRNEAPIFPKLIVYVKLGLGGYASHEFVTLVYEDVRTDFGSGTIILDEAGPDLAITAAVVSSEPAVIEGQVTMRASGRKGKIWLQNINDEPGGQPPPSPLPLIPALAGDYMGQCGPHRTLLQVQTARGIGTPHDAAGGLEGYRVVGRLAYHDRALCRASTGTLPWCKIYDFDEGAYDFNRGILSFASGQGLAGSCTLRNGMLSCDVRDVNDGHLLRCRLAHGGAPPATTPRFVERQSHLQTTTEQRLDLPPPNPPENRQLKAALNGSFTGYLHNETTDLYQPLEVHVLATNSTPNPHNENQVVVSATVASYLGRDLNGPQVTERLEHLVFYPQSGFALSSSEAATTLLIQDWRQGYVTGIWYSKRFGRVGTFQLVKGSLQPLPVTAHEVQSPATEFRDGHAGTNGNGLSVWVRSASLEVVPQAPQGRDGLVALAGTFRPRAGLGGTALISGGAFDTYTGTLAWPILGDGKEGSLITGNLDHNGALLAIWPQSPGDSTFGAPMRDSRPEKFLNLRPR